MKIPIKIGIKELKKNQMKKVRKTIKARKMLFFEEIRKFETAQ